MHGLSGRKLILLPLLACACQSRRVAPLELGTAGALPTHSWVVLTGGTRVPVDRGMFTRDSIIGFQGAGERFAVSRDSVASVEERRETSTSASALGALKLVGYVTMGALIITTLMLLTAISQWE